MSDVGTQVSWLKIPIVGLPEMACQLPVTKDGRALDRDGDPLPMHLRTRECGAEGRWMLGSVFLCQVHAAEVARMMDDSIEDIEEEWRARL